MMIDDIGPTYPEAGVSNGDRSTFGPRMNPANAPKSRGTGRTESRPESMARRHQESGGCPEIRACPPDDKRRCDGGDAGGRMDDQPAREIDDPEGLEPPADAPVPMGDGHVDERRPGDDVDHERLEPDPLREGAYAQGGRDRCKLQFKGEVEEFR